MVEIAPTNVGGTGLVMPLVPPHPVAPTRWMLAESVPGTKGRGLGMAKKARNNALQPGRDTATSYLTACAQGGMGRGGAWVWTWIRSAVGVCSTRRTVPLSGSRIFVVVYAVSNHTARRSTLSKD